MREKIGPSIGQKALRDPKSGTTSSAISLAIRSAFWSGTGKTISHFVKRSWITTTCLYPLSVIGRSITSIPST